MEIPLNRIQTFSRRLDVLVIVLQVVTVVFLVANVVWSPIAHFGPVFSDAQAWVTTEYGPTYTPRHLFMMVAFFLDNSFMWTFHFLVTLTQTALLLWAFTKARKLLARYGEGIVFDHLNGHYITGIGWLFFWIQLISQDSGGLRFGFRGDPGVYVSFDPAGLLPTLFIVLLGHVIKAAAEMKDELDEVV